MRRNYAGVVALSVKNSSPSSSNLAVYSDILAYVAPARQVIRFNTAIRDILSV